MAAAAKSNTNWFAVGISAVAVIVLVGLGALVVFLNNQAGAPGVAPQSTIIDEDSGAIVVGEGGTEVDTFVDFMCPACNSFEQAYGAQLQQAAADGDITLRLHPVAILNHQSQGTDYSSRAGGAVYCVAAEAPDSTLDFFNLLFANQPQGGTAGLSDDDMSALAEQVGAGAAADCIADGTYMKFVEDQTNAHDIASTPTVKIDDELVNLQAGGQEQLNELLG
ncbi:DsbA family protein [Microbacterium sp. A196]|uniref:DsbA family protein n=1 Tax=Microbacterium sp. A196 TaxID=3457320 RepID=UPI003FD174DB